MKLSNVLAEKTLHVFSAPGARASYQSLTLQEKTMSCDLVAFIANSDRRCDL